VARQRLRQQPHHHGQRVLRSQAGRAGRWMGRPARLRRARWYMTCRSAGLQGRP
jgi:hypothetical protein